MNQICLIAFGNELVKVLNIINRSQCNIKHIITLPTDDLEATLENIVQVQRIACKISFYDSMPEILHDEYFDYVIVSDRMNIAGKKNRIVEDLERVGVASEKILNISSFFSGEFFPLYSLLKNFGTNHPYVNYEFFVTGVSHAYAGTDISQFSVPGMKLAQTSQDLFFDYELAKIAMKYNRNKISKLKFAIIGVAPFSLHHDLSQSVNVGRALAYFPMTKTVHNCPVDETKLAELFNESYLDFYDRFEDGLAFNQLFVCNSLNKNFTLDDFIDIRKTLSIIQKEYPDTAKENKEILRNYLSDCLRENILPILVIYPVSEFYNKYFSSRKFDEVRITLEDFSQKFNVPFHDFSRDSRFQVSDFFDVEHLNINGAKKISGILNQLLTSLNSER